MTENGDDSPRPRLAAYRIQHDIHFNSSALSIQSGPPTQVTTKKTRSSAITSKLKAYTIGLYLSEACKFALLSRRLNNNMVMRIMASNNNTHPKDHNADDEVEGGASEPRTVNGSKENDFIPASVVPLTTSLHKKNGGNSPGGGIMGRNKCSRRVSFERGKGGNFRSSLGTVESVGGGSVDIYTDDDRSHSSGNDEKNLRSSTHSNGTTGTNDSRRHRRHSTGGCSSVASLGSSANSLMVSFSRLNENELTHLRKWNRRLQR